MKTTKDLIPLATFWTIAFMFFVFFVLVALALITAEPYENIEIRQSYSTGKCVSMIVYNKEHPNGKVHPCPDVLPERYTHIWVQ